ncbi:hypothetical protein [Streptomyces sp. PCS3-D2]|uniref:hypothetical protein n=1 Tax=Streptomyces sp. PCS3-D2 TaxID=1460244 RepID=UPI00055E2C5D|nr:hypothetical protein [Streptomyces sp. PCS3-D2]
MSTGPGYHRTSEQRLHARTAENGAPAPVVTSAGALVHGLHTIVLTGPYARAPLPGARRDPGYRMGGGTV